MGERGPIVKDERYAQARKEFKDNPEAETAAAAGERYGGHATASCGPSARPANATPAAGCPAGR